MSSSIECLGVALGTAAFGVGSWSGAAVCSTAAAGALPLVGVPLISDLIELLAFCGTRSFSIDSEHSEVTQSLRQLNERLAGAIPGKHEF